nr:MAG TPA: hypothetical protein [Crassvirales sp.]
MITHMDLKKKLGIYVGMKFIRSLLHSILGFHLILKILIINFTLLIEIHQNL